MPLTHSSMQSGQIDRDRRIVEGRPTSNTVYDFHGSLVRLINGSKENRLLNTAYLEIN